MVPVKVLCRTRQDHGRSSRVHQSSKGHFLAVVAEVRDGHEALQSFCCAPGTLKMSVTPFGLRRFPSREIARQRWSPGWES